MGDPNKGIDFKKIVAISNKTHGYINILSFLYEKLKERYNTYLKESSKHTSKFNEHFQNFLRTFTEYHILIEKEIGEKPNSDPRIKPIVLLYNEYLKPNLEDGKYDVFILEKKFFRPIIKILDMDRLDDRTIPLTNISISCLNDIKSIRLEREYLSTNLNSILEQYEELVDNLHKILNELDKH